MIFYRSILACVLEITIIPKTTSNLRTSLLCNGTLLQVPPPGIDFTLPSPPIGITQVPVVDPPWMPYIKTKVEELSLKEEEQSTSQTIMTMTRTRRKQKQEMVKRAVREAEEKQSELRQQFPLVSFL